MADRRHDARLAIIPVIRADTGKVPKFGPRTISSYQQARFEVLTRSQLNIRMALPERKPACCCRCMKHDPQVRGLLVQCRQHDTVRNHIGERLAIGDFTTKGQEHRPDRIPQAAVRDDHFVDRLGVGQDFGPYSELLQHPRSCCCDCRCAGILVQLIHRFGIDHRDTKAGCA